jgi:hypothetical protein
VAAAAVPIPVALLGLHLLLIVYLLMAAVPVALILEV